MLDIQGAKGTIKSLPPKRNEVSEGQLMTVDVEPMIDVFVTPEQYDQFFDNVNAGASPSAFLWRRGMGGEGDQTAYLRWHSFGKIEFGLPSQEDHVLKLETVKLSEESDEEYKRTKIEVALVCRPGKKGHAEPMTNAARLQFKVRGHATADQHAKLLELFRREELSVSFYQRQADLAPTRSDDLKPKRRNGSGKNSPPAPQAGGATEENTPQLGGITDTNEAASVSDSGGEESASPPPSDDKLYPKAEEAVRAVDALSHVTPKLLQIDLKIGAVRAKKLMDALSLAGVLGPIKGDGSYQVLGQPTESAAPAAGQRNPKCVHDWDELRQEWTDSAGKRVEPQPRPPQFVKVNAPPDGDKTLE